MRLILDSCILIDFLNGIPSAGEFVRGLDAAAVSVVTHIEVLAGVTDEQAWQEARDLLATFERHDLTLNIAEAAARLRPSRRLLLADAIIRATAEVHGLRIVTRNTRDFPADDPRVLVPYTLN